MNIGKAINPRYKTNYTISKINFTKLFTNTSKITFSNPKLIEREIINSLVRDIKQCDDICLSSLKVKGKKTPILLKQNGKYEGWFMRDVTLDAKKTLIEVSLEYKQLEKDEEKLYLFC